LFPGDPRHVTHLLEDRCDHFCLRPQEISQAVFHQGDLTSGLTAPGHLRKLAQPRANPCVKARKPPHRGLQTCRSALLSHNISLT
jgi:hypothetical protein